MRKDIFEIHKPSALITSEYKTPIVKRGRIKGYEHYTLTPLQHDAMNYMCYLAREQIHKKMDVEKTLASFDSEDKLFAFLEVQHFELNLNDLAKFTGKYQIKQNKTELSNILDSLRAVSVKVGIFKQDNLLRDVHAVKTMSLLRNYTRVTNSNKATFQLEPEILLGWIHKTKPFAKLYLKIQTKLKLTYSKILYEICKDYENLSTPLTKEFSDWLKVLCIDSTKANTNTPSQLKGAYLNKAIKEINANTDIFIDNIYGTKKEGKLTMTVEFHKQECDLITNITKELSIEDQILMNKAELIYDNLPKFRKDKINNKEQYIKSIFKKDYDKLKNELRLDNWINNEINNEINNISIQNDQPQTLSILIGNNAYAITDEYLIKDLDSNDTITKNATETIEFLNNIIDNNEYNKDYTLEMLELGNNHLFSKSSVNLF